MQKKQIGLEEEIVALALAFAHEVASAARMQTLDKVRGAFAKGLGESERAIEQVRGAERKPNPHKAKYSAIVKGSKRDPQALARLGARLVRYVASQPGKNIEQIARGLQCTTKALVLPMNKALASGEITKKGARRGTRYYTK